VASFTFRPLFPGEEVPPLVLIELSRSERYEEKNNLLLLPENVPGSSVVQPSQYTDCDIPAVTEFLKITSLNVGRQRINQINQVMHCNVSALS
jgi:hypothetical protein